MVIDANSIVPMYRQLASLLRLRIASGEIGDGERLPSEAQLGELFGVSRVTIRQALADLERAGLLERAAGKGTFARNRQPPIEGLTRLSGFSENARAAGFEVGYQVLRTGEEPVSARVARQLKLEEPRAFVVARVLLANGFPAGMHASHLPLWLARRVGSDALGSEAMNHGSLYAALEKAGTVLHRAEESLEPATVDADQAEHLRLASGALVQRVHRTVFDTDERPVIFESDTYRPDAYTYRVELYRKR